MTLLEIYFVVCSALMGACVGSFLNVCIYRLPREDLSVNKPARSFCPVCGYAIPWYENIPFFSWLSLGGRCRLCRTPIATRYLLVEGLTAALFAVVAVRYLTHGPPIWGAYFAMLTFISALIVSSFVDLDLRILPDEITVGGMILAPFVVLLAPELHTQPVDGSVSWLLLSVQERLEPWARAVPDALQSPGARGTLMAVGAAGGGLLGLHGYSWYWRLTRRGERCPLRDGLLGGVLGFVVGGAAVLAFLAPETLLHPRVYSVWAALIGMFAGATLVFLIGELGTRLFRKPAMGFGDVKLMGLLGAFTGWAGVVAGFFVACILGSVVGVFILLRHRSRYLPFGPFLALGCLSMILWPEPLEWLFAWYLGLFRS